MFHELISNMQTNLKFLQMWLGEFVLQALNM